MLVAFDPAARQFSDAIRRWIARRRSSEPDSPPASGAASAVDQLRQAIEHQSRLVETMVGHLEEQRREISRMEKRTARLPNGDASAQLLAQFGDAVAEQRLHMTALAIAVQRLAQLLAARMPLP